MIRVLALDIASSTGVCYDDPARPNAPCFKTWDLRVPGPEGYGTKFAELARRLNGLLASLGQSCPTVLAFEEPLNVKRRSKKMSNYTTRLLIGLASVAELTARQHGMQCFEVPVSTGKAHFGGRTTDSDPKAAVLARCRQLGWPVKNSDEADSGALWSFTKARLDQKFSYQSTPLFWRQK